MQPKFDLQLFAETRHHHHGAHHAEHHKGEAEKRRQPFADGTTDFPTPIQGLGSALTAAANGGNVTPLTPVPKTGFVGQFNHTVAGTLTVGTAGTNFQIPLHRIMSNYTLANSLQFPYRNLNYDDIWFWANIGDIYTGPFDSIYGSATLQMPPVTGLGSPAFQYSFTDWIGLNDGVNFSKYLLAALTNSNDLTILITWLTTTNIAFLEANANAARFTAYTASDAVSCVYNTVPDPDKWYWPDTSKVQQCIGDPSFQTLQASATNNINLTPISGPDFLGIGIQVIWNTTTLGWLTDPLTVAGSGIVQIGLFVGGSIPLKVFTLSDLLRFYEHRFGRSPSFGYLYIDMTTDLGQPNNMSNVMRKALATTKYAQMTLQVVTNGNQAAGTGAKVNVFKRTQQQYAGNAAIL